jgi:HNH endonuclease
VEFWVANTDLDWFEFLAAHESVDEVNFWSGSVIPPKRLPQGAPWIFKLHVRQGGWVVGGAYFATFTPITVRFAWDAFGELNGAPSYEALLRAVSRYSVRRIDGDTTPSGSAVLLQPFFLPPQLWVHPPAAWSVNLTRGKSYDSTDGGEGQLLWERVQRARVMLRADGAVPLAEVPGGYGSPTLIRPRLGQGAFRVMVTEAYQRRCAVTNERTLPVLDAAHIKPFALVGEHELSNGLLLRSDLHTLFDRGYVTVTPNLEFRVSRKIRDQFENGRDYYALDRRPVRLPVAPNPQPSREMLEWHSDVVFKG